MLHVAVLFYVWMNEFLLSTLDLFLFFITNEAFVAVLCSLGRAGPASLHPGCDIIASLVPFRPYYQRAALPREHISSSSSRGPGASLFTAAASTDYQAATFYLDTTHFSFPRLSPPRCLPGRLGHSWSVFFPLWVADSGLAPTRQQQGALIVLIVMVVASRKLWGWAPWKPSVMRVTRSSDRHPSRSALYFIFLSLTWLLCTNSFCCRPDSWFLSRVCQKHLVILLTASPSGLRLSKNPFNTHGNLSSRLICCPTVFRLCY